MSLYNITFLLVWQSPFPKRLQYTHTETKTVLYMSYARCVVMSVNHGIILSGVGITSACSSSAASDVCTCAPAIWICSSCESCVPFSCHVFNEN